MPRDARESAWEARVPLQAGLGPFEIDVGGVKWLRKYSRSDPLAAFLEHLECYQCTAWYESSDKGAFRKLVLGFIRDEEINFVNSSRLFRVWLDVATWRYGLDGVNPSRDIWAGTHTALQSRVAWQKENINHGEPIPSCDQIMTAVRKITKAAAKEDLDNGISVPGTNQIVTVVKDTNEAATRVNLNDGIPVPSMDQIGTATKIINGAAAKESLNDGIPVLDTSQTNQSWTDGNEVAIRAWLGQDEDPNDDIPVPKTTQTDTVVATTSEAAKANPDDAMPIPDENQTNTSWTAGNEAAIRAWIGQEEDPKDDILVPETIQIDTVIKATNEAAKGNPDDAMPVPDKNQINLSWAAGNEAAIRAWLGLDENHEDDASVPEAKQDITSTKNTNEEVNKHNTCAGQKENLDNGMPAPDTNPIDTSFTAGNEAAIRAWLGQDETLDAGMPTNQIDTSFTDGNEAAIRAWLEA